MPKPCISNNHSPAVVSLRVKADLTAVRPAYEQGHRVPDAGSLCLPLEPPVEGVRLSQRAEVVGAIDVQLELCHAQV